MITREEYKFLKKIKTEGSKWIARDKNWKLYRYSEMPKRCRTIWNFGGVAVNIRGEYFTSVKWEDEKPTEIYNLIRDYESHQAITGGNNLNKAELIKEIEDILYNIGIHDYRIGERFENYSNWGIDSKNIRKIFSAIEKCSPENVKVTIPKYVADWIEEVKGLKRNFKLEYLFDTTEMPDDVYNWLDGQVGDTDILAKAWLDGFIVSENAPTENNEKNKIKTAIKILEELLNE